jgi:hypothetical protein
MQDARLKCREFVTLLGGSSLHTAEAGGMVGIGSTRMDSALLQNLVAGTGSSSQFVGGLVIALLYVVIGLLRRRDPRRVSRNWF